MLKLSKTILNKGSQEKGSIAVLVALTLTMLLGFGAIVSDVGIIYVKHAHLQNALDAAALAGVQDLPADPDKAESIAREYAGENGINEVNVNFFANASEIQLDANEEVPAFLARIWGIKENKIYAKSKAMMVPPHSMTGAVPLSVNEQNFVYGKEYFLKSGTYSDTSQNSNQDGSYSGWYGVLRLNGQGASVYEDYLKYGYEGTLAIGQILEIEDGNMSGPTKRGVNYRLAQDTRVPKNTFDNYDRNAPEIIYVPIVRIIERNGDSVQEVEIVGFAAFFLESVGGNGTDSIVKGRFIKTLVGDGKSGGSLDELRLSEEQMEEGSSSSDFGLYAPKLVSK